MNRSLLPLLYLLLQAAQKFLIFLVCGHNFTLDFRICNIITIFLLFNCVLPNLLLRPSLIYHPILLDMSSTS
jgi:hypothetical protein